MKYIRKSDLIQECNEKGVDLGKDFHALRRSQVHSLYEIMGSSEFQTPFDRPGSRLREFYYFLSDNNTSNGYGWLWEPKSYPCNLCGCVCVSVVSPSEGSLRLVEYKSYKVSGVGMRNAPVIHIGKELNWECEDCI